MCPSNEVSGDKLAKNVLKGPAQKDKSTLQIQKAWYPIAIFSVLCLPLKNTNSIKSQSQSAQHRPEFHIKSYPDIYPSTALHTGTQSKTRQTAQEKLTDMRFLFLSEEKKKTKG